MEDLGALRITDAHEPPRTVVAAGTPWFMTLFGRDSLLTSWMLLPIDLSLVAGTLHVLADLQGRAVNPTPRRTRAGSCTRCEPGSRAPNPPSTTPYIYYGSTDVTPLFVIMAGELLRWWSVPRGSRRSPSRPG